MSPGVKRFAVGPARAPGGTGRGGDRSAALMRPVIDTSGEGKRAPV